LELGGSVVIQNVSEWELELVQTGKIVQDGDISVSPDEAEKRFSRYVELVDMVEGDEGPEVVKALVRSIQVRYDYGAYQGTMNAILDRFPMELMVPVLLSELPDLIQRQPEWAGDIINQVTHQDNTAAKVVVRLFNKEVSKLSPQDRQSIMKFIRQEENGGWLEGRQGILCPQE
jgi:hypothetical protein